MSPAPIEFPVEGLVGGDLRLRLHADADVPALVEACRDPVVQRYTRVPEQYGPDDARTFQDEGGTGMADGMQISLVIADAESDHLLGTIAARRNPTDGGRWDLGYLVAPWARRRGVATRAVRLLTAHLFDEHGAERVELIVEPENEASHAVADGAGFRREGTLRGYHPLKGTRRDVVMFSMLREERATLRVP